ncbi:YtrH family sporulation protein [Bacillus coahuilensis]|uniref:YtrH family sporulation protein n=1 Tax=Bacillus coahuilensis TaxID=408580 RepID=UPI000493F8EF
MKPLCHNLLNVFLPSFGVIVGGSFLGGLGAFLMGEPPLSEIHRLSKILRIWAIIAALGGTFDTLYSFEKGLLDGETKDLVKQFLLILSSMGGAYVGAHMINWFCQESMST